MSMLEYSEVYKKGPLIKPPPFQPEEPVSLPNESKIPVHEIKAQKTAGRAVFMNFQDGKMLPVCRQVQCLGAGPPK